MMNHFKLFIRSRLQRPVLRLQPAEHDHRLRHHRRRPQHRPCRRIPRLLPTQTQAVVQEVSLG